MRFAWGAVGVFVGLLAFAEATVSIKASAQTYDAELKGAAVTLASSLEHAGQHSGTVIDFTDLQGSPNELGRFLAQEFADDLVNVSKRVTFVDRANLQYLLREHKMSVEGLINPESGRKLGRLIGIDTLIFGTEVPIGDKIRLNIRAVSVESGQIIAAESVNLAPPPTVSGLRTHGVSRNPSAAFGNRADLRDRLGENSLRLKAYDVAGPLPGLGWAAVNFGIQNLSGIGLGVALQAQGTALGPCTTESEGSGLPRITASDIEQLRRTGSPSTQLRWLPNGATANATIKMQCGFRQFLDYKSVPLTVTIVAAAGHDVVVLPISGQSPVRVPRVHSQCPPGQRQEGGFCFPVNGGFRFQ